MINVPTYRWVGMIQLPRYQTLVNSSTLSLYIYNLSKRASSEGSFDKPLALASKTHSSFGLRLGKAPRPCSQTRQLSE